MDEITLDYILVDLDIVRDHGLIENAIEDGREQLNYDRVTTFTWVTAGELDKAGAIVDGNIAIIAEPVPHVWRRYKQECRAQSRALWRGQLTDAEDAALLEQSHRIAMLTGWR